MTYGVATVREATALAETGMPIAAIARRLSVSRAAIRDWLDQDVEELVQRRAFIHGQPNGAPHSGCLLRRDVPRSEYAYLLGQYLGDGYLAAHPRGVYRLTIACCDWYPNIVEECAAAMRTVLPPSKVGFTNAPGVIRVGSYSKHWPCLFPQHGPGKKHERRIELTDWQQMIVADHARMFVRGLIHSDGCRDINRVRVRGRWYAYSRYSLSNKSADILKLFGASCDALGVEWRYSRYDVISVARRGSVALLDEFVGPKS